MEPLDLARGGRRPRRGQQVLDAVLPADPIEQHLTGAGPEPAGEHLAVVGQDLGRHTMRAHRQRQRLTRRPGRRPGHDQRRDAEPRVVIDPGHDLRLGAVGEAHAADDVHLPQLHRPGPLPTLVVGLLATPRLRGDQPVTDQAPIDRRAARHRVDALTTQPVADRARPPTRMLDPHLHDPRLDLRGHLMRTRTRHRRAVHQAGQPPRRVALQPAMHALTSHPEPGRDLGDRHPVVQHLENGLIALLHKPELHQHDDTSWSRTSTRKHSPSASRA